MLTVYYVIRAPNRQMLDSSHNKHLTSIALTARTRLLFLHQLPTSSTQTLFIRDISIRFKEDKFASLTTLHPRPQWAILKLTEPSSCYLEKYEMRYIDALSKGITPSPSFFRRILAQQC